MPAWLVGRQWCHAGLPDCPACILRDVCPKDVDRDSTVRDAWGCRGRSLSHYVRSNLSCPTASALLVSGARRTMVGAWGQYPHLYDQVLEEVHARLNFAGHATKLDLAALIAWKHVQNAPWMQELLKFPPLGVQQRTQAAFAANKSDRQRIDALESIPGFGSGNAFTSTFRRLAPDGIRSVRRQGQWRRLGSGRGLLMPM